LPHLVVPSCDDKNRDLLLLGDIPELFTSKLLYELEVERNSYRPQVESFIESNSLMFYFVFFLTLFMFSHIQSKTTQLKVSVGYV
jgi:hypothetical protein